MQITGIHRGFVSRKGTCYSSGAGCRGSMLFGAALLNAFPIVFLNVFPTWVGSQRSPSCCKAKLDRGHLRLSSLFPLRS